MLHCGLSITQILLVFVAPLLSLENYFGNIEVPLAINIIPLGPRFLPDFVVNNASLSNCTPPHHPQFDSKYLIYISISHLIVL